MTMRRTPPPHKGSFVPPNDTATHRDLLRFEERLKSNAANLRRRKSRYQLFLVQLLVIIVFLLSEVVLHTSFMTIPYRIVLRKIFPKDYADNLDIELHPYVPKALLTVAITTLLLFFASGLYAEKIGYANRYVPHANKALRNFNMHLNVRHHPLRSRLLVNPFSSLFGQTSSDERTLTAPRPPSPSLRPKRGVSVTIPPIPPTSNPRGELIFSSRVDRNFRESYERYRSIFERKREEREMIAAAQTWWGWYVWPWNWPKARYRTSSLRGHGHTDSLSMRGRATDTESAVSSPASSRRSSPVPGPLKRTRGNGSKRSGTPPGGVPERLIPDRTRRESFSSLLSEDQQYG